ncbi:MAG: class D beta-lactamase [Firmicutes bacterium]|nr:class D beta-lactamase [Bacillota bacterium]
MNNSLLKKTFPLIILALMLIISAGIRAEASADYEKVFREKFAGTKGCMVIYSLNDDTCLMYNPVQCKTRYSPCSTFKIFNSLTALETGVHKDENSILKYDGSPQMFDSWKKDHTMATAIRDSVVWYYQKTAEMIGEKRMQEYLDKADYGNRDISAGITKFWLGSSLLISAAEQVDFLTKLCRDQLPFGKHATDTVKKIMILSSDKDFQLAGKTGSSYKNGKWVLGWFVGFVKKDNKTWVFAANITGDDNCDGKRAKAISIGVLKDLGILPEGFVLK